MVKVLVGRTIRIGDLLWTALAPTLWGTTYAVATELLPPGHPLLVAALRSLPVGVLLMFWTRQLPQGVWWWRILVLGLLNIGVFQALLFVAAYRLPGGVAATVGAIQPLLVVGISWMLLHQQPAKGAIRAAIAGLVGVGLLVLGPEAQLDGIGILAALAGAGAMGLGTVLVKRWGSPVSLLTFTAWQLVVGGLALLPVALVFEGPFSELTLTHLGGFVYLGLIGTGLAYALWFRGIERLNAAAVSYLGLMSPVVATILGFVFLQQNLSGMQLLGILTIGISIVFGQISQQRVANL